MTVHHPIDSIAFFDDLLEAMASDPDRYERLGDIDVELATNPPNAMLEEGSTGPGWAGQQITELRFDPHEDPGVRCFTLDDIKVSTVDIAAPLRHVAASPSCPAGRMAYGAAMLGTILPIVLILS